MKFIAINQRAARRGGENGDEHIIKVNGDEHSIKVHGDEHNIKVSEMRDA